ncbi:hypothetical protein ACIA8G_19715 [Lentzea sp. NPDC051213]|uniref:hypothetical protein n=1 Tax=Lentzea sp. NPDC051213 TaxID=3364126 RepID=UPI0037AFC6C6
MGAVALIAIGLVGAGVLWQNSLTRRPEPRTETRRLRSQAPWYVGAGLLAFVAANFTYGLFIAARADFWPRQTEGSGVATSCDRDWRYLGATWRCNVDITAESKLSQEMDHSQFTEADIGHPKAVTFTGLRWETVDQPDEHRFAKALLILLMAGGVALSAKPLFDLARARDLEAPGLPRRHLPLRAP